MFSRTIRAVGQGKKEESEVLCLYFVFLYFLDFLNQCMYCYSMVLMFPIFNLLEFKDEE